MENVDLLTSSYASAIAAAGGVPLLLPAVAVRVEGGLEAALDGVHALVLSGGPDVDPARYGQPREALTDEPRTERDEWELALAQAAVRRGLPLLGICRGLQVLNVALGGTLFQHLPHVVGSDLHRPKPGAFTSHPVRTQAGSRIGTTMGSVAVVPGHHHQGVDVLGADLVATAWSDDGLVEAAEIPGDSWLVAVQWHPEEGSGESLFAAFVSAALEYRAAASALAR